MKNDNDNDAALLRDIASGARTALATAFDRHGTVLSRYAWALAASRMDVEELVQDTFVTLWQRAGTVAIPADSMLPWLLVVCRNHARNLARRQARAQSDALPDDLAAPERTDDAAELLRWVHAEIAALAPIDRRVVELCLVDGHSYSEAAEQLGLSVGAVTQRVSRSRARLRKAVTHDEH